MLRPLLYVFFFTATKSCLISLFVIFFLKKFFNITNFVKVMINKTNRLHVL